MRLIRLNISIFCLLIPIACVKSNNTGWSESELQALPSQVAILPKPPILHSANLIRYERDVALKMFDLWAAFILRTQKDNPNSPLNQLRRIFNPDHLKSLDLGSAIALATTDGSGTHGALAYEKKPQDTLYHALWSRIADAAGVLKYPRSSRHMKHYLGNSGVDIQYSAEETNKILSTDRTSPEDTLDPVGLQLEVQFLKDQFHRLNVALEDEYLSSIAKMTHDERMFYVSRLKLKSTLASYVSVDQINTAADLKMKLADFNNRSLRFKPAAETGAWQRFRPLSSAHQMISSKQNTDMYFSFGSYTATHHVAPLSLEIKNEQISWQLSQWTQIFDKYNWDNGKFVTLLSSWCWSLDSPHCGNIEELTSIEVNDKSLGRLHKLGIAKEYEIHGNSVVETFEDTFAFKELKDASKVAQWKAEVAVLYPNHIVDQDD